MKGLRKFIPPFAPDQSGACSVLYALGGIIVICDAGGCAGNICGFDEPRWFKSKSAIFSAGLRDMDAILGRDDKLVEKLLAVAEKIDASFAAIVGTPVPAVIGTDYMALRRMAEKKLNIPVLTIDTNGMKLYDEGVQKAYLSLFKRFAKEKMSVDHNAVGVIGALPLEMTALDDGEKIRSKLLSQGYEKVICYGMDGSLTDVEYAPNVDKNIVLSPAGIKSAKYLQEKFSTPYEIAFPLADDMVKVMDYDFAGKRVLVIHQQVIANDIRAQLEKAGAMVTNASWFMLNPDIRREGDIFLQQEDDLAELTCNNDFDVIIADETMRRACIGFKGEFIDLPHFAVSGKM